MLGECSPVLKPSGILSIATPDVETIGFGGRPTPRAGCLVNERRPKPVESLIPVLGTPAFWVPFARSRLRDTRYAMTSEGMYYVHTCRVFNR